MISRIVGIGAVLCASSVLAANTMTVTVEHDLATARPSETIVIPFVEVKRRLTNIVFDQIEVKDASGRVIPSQVIGYVHSHKGPQNYDQVVFQHDFPAGEKRATFTLSGVAKARPPFETKVFARYVPERFDDFAWENDRMGHRAYGPALELATAGKDQMTSSGLDLWTKKVRYPIVDRWYHKGHDGLHTDTGEGLDMYEVGMNRGAGGTGIWNGSRLAVSSNWRSWKIFANGPIRAIFELEYAPWDAGNGVMVAETKRFTVDAGQQLDEVHSTFTFAGASELTAAIGISLHTTIADVAVTRSEKLRALGVWEKYKNPDDGTLGVGIVLDPSAAFAGYADLPATPDVPRLVRPESLVLSKVKSAQPLRYFIGGAWAQAGDITSQQQWDAYLADWATRLKSPLRLSYSAAQ